MDDERQRLLILIAATAGAVLIPLNTSMLSVGLAPIVAAFGVTNEAGTWLILLYLAIMTSVQPTAGKLGDRYGHRPVFLTGLLLVGLASVGAALAPSFWLLVLFRVLQGFAGAALAPNAAALIRHSYPVERQGHAMGLYVSVFSVGLTAGPVISGLVISLFGWPGIFWINLPLVALSVWLGFQVLPRSRTREAVHFDWWGTLLFGTMVTSIVLASNLWKEERSPLPGWLMLTLLAGMALAFWRVEERADDPLLRFSLFRLPGFGAANAAIFLLHTIMYAVLVVVPLYLQQGRGISPGQTGVILGVYSVVQVIVAPFAGRLSDRLGRRPMVVAGGLLYATASFMLLAVTPETSLLYIASALVLGSAGTGLTSAPVQAAALAACPTNLVGVGAGVWYSSRYLGNISGALLTGLLLPERLSTGAAPVYQAMMVTALLLALSALWFPKGQAVAATRT